MRSITDDLPTHPLGNSGLRITRVGFGSWAVGGGGWLLAGVRKTMRRLWTRCAMRSRREINWIDTAAIYGLGHSEEVVGKLLRELPQRRAPAHFH